MTDDPQNPVDSEVPPEIPQPTQSVRKRSPMFLALAGGAGCLILSLIVVTGIYFFVRNLGKEEINTVNDQLAALRNNDIDRAYSYCSLEFQKVTSTEDFLTLVETYPILRNAKEFSSLDRQKQATGTTVLKGTIIGRDGSKLPAEYQLVREKDKWKIQFLRLSPAGIQVDQPQQAASKNPTTKPAPVQVLGIQNMQIEHLKVDKQKKEEGLVITVTFQVVNFGNDKSSGFARIHLVQDLKTLDPSGSILPSLSKDAINEFKESGEPEYKSADFKYTLTIPSDYPAGKYQMVITVHDRIGGSAAATTAQFEL
ncbi:MAG TPA: DUF4864 domain-containing protein [Acidobacteriota bacterium]|nr:DUF4864 domain-containing protein [Acidobacteriota bacterium]